MLLDNGAGFYGGASCGQVRMCRDRRGIVKIFYGYNDG